MIYDVIIIGGGLGGLACGSLLSRMGKSVLVLEQGQQVGGCLQSYSRGGMAFDTGFHYVGGLDEGQSLHAAFRALGLLDLPWHRLDSDGFDRVSIGQRTFRLVEGYDEFANRLSDYFPRERKGIEAFTDLLRKTACTQLDALNPHAVQSDLAMRLIGKGAWPYLSETFSDPLLISVLSGTLLKAELRRESLPLFTFLHTLGGYVESSWRLCGDGSLIAYRLVEQIERNGGTVKCNARITELEEKGGLIVSAICADGEAYSGRMFISSIHPSLTCDLVRRSDRMRSAYRNRLNSMGNTIGAFTVSLRMKPHSLPYFNHNYYIYRQDDVWNLGENGEDVNAVMVSCRVPNDGSPFTQQVDLLTPMAWRQCEQWAGTRPCHRNSDYMLMKKRVAESCIHLAETQVPELCENSRPYISTPLTWHDYTLTPCGSAYGIRKDYHHPLLAIISPRTPVPNLLLTGQSLMLHGLHGTTMTALFTCAEVVGKEAVWQIVNK